MGIKAAKKMFEEFDIDIDSIDFVLFCTQSPDYFLPTSACIIQNSLGLRNNVGALDFNLGCSGYIYGLSLAKGLITAEIAKNVLLITAETYSKFINSNDKNNVTIFGDGASASLITDNSNNMKAEICNFSLGTDGKGAENLIVKNGGMRYRNSKVRFEDADFTEDDFLYMNGKEIFNFTSKMIPPLVEDVLKKNDKILENIDLHIFHQANKYMLDHIRKKIGISPENFYLHLENCGNTVSSTIPIALYHALQEDRIRKGNILLTGFGVGYSWGSVLLSFN
jgi:3-oxoacyl-[acyl-carrier-protein] synthase-3